MKTKVESEGEEEALEHSLPNEDPEPPEPSLDAPDGPPTDNSSPHSCSGEVDVERDSYFYHELKQPDDETHTAGINMEEPSNSLPVELTPTEDSFLTLEYIQVSVSAFRTLHKMGHNV